jgi:hypothetical protein
MNNSFFAIEGVSLTVDTLVEHSETLKEQEGKLLKIIEALREIQGTKAWSTLKELVFDGITDSLDKEIQAEAREEKPDTLKLNRLAGQLKWAEKFSDLGTLEKVFRTSLTNIRKRTNANN